MPFPCALLAALLLPSSGADLSVETADAEGATVADAQDSGTSRWGARVFLGQGLLLFSSEDIRNGGGVAGTYTIPYPRLRFRSHRGELSAEGYVARTHSAGASGKPPNDISAYGILAMARYRGHSRSGVAGYFEMGWGFQYVEQRSVDLDNRFNTTPTLGIGIATRAPGGNEVFIGARLMHVSNGGLAKGNQGQNFAFLTMAVKF